MRTPTDDERIKGSYAWHFLLGYLSETHSQSVADALLEIANGLGIEPEEFSEQTKLLIDTMKGDKQ